MDKMDTESKCQEGKKKWKFGKWWAWGEFMGANQASQLRIYPNDDETCLRRPKLNSLVLKNLHTQTATRPPMAKANCATNLEVAIQNPSFCCDEGLTSETSASLDYPQWLAYFDRCSVNFIHCYTPDQLTNESTGMGSRRNSS